MNWTYEDDRPGRHSVEVVCSPHNTRLNIDFLTQPAVRGVGEKFVETVRTKIETELNADETFLQLQRLRKEIPAGHEHIAAELAEIEKAEAELLEKRQKLVESKQTGLYRRLVALDTELAQIVAAKKAATASIDPLVKEANARHQALQADLPNRIKRARIEVSDQTQARRKELLAQLLAVAGPILDELVCVEIERGYWPMQGACERVSRTLLVASPVPPTVEEPEPPMKRDVDDAHCRLLNEHRRARLAEEAEAKDKASAIVWGPAEPAPAA